MFRNKLLPIILLVLAFLFSLANVGYAKMLELITDTATGKTGWSFATLATVVIVYLLATAFINFGFSYFKKWYRLHIMKQVRDDLYSSILKEEIFDFENRPRDFYLSKFTTDLEMLEEDYYGNIMYATGLSLNLILAVAMTLEMQWQITIAILLLSLPSLLLPFFGRNLLKSLRTPVLASIQQVTTTVNDTLSGFRLLKFNQAEQKFIKNMAGETKTLKQTSRNEALIQQIISAGSDLFGNVMYLGTWVVGTYFVIKKQISLGQLVSLSQLVVFITIPLGEITPVLTEFFGGEKVGQNISKLINYQPGATNTEPSAYLISYQDVSVQIEKKQVLTHITTQIPFNQKTIIVGESGAGKSSLINVLLGTIPISSGSFCILDKKNQPLTTPNFEEIGFLPQESVILNGTLLDNVRLFDENISGQAVEQALKDVSLEKLIPRLTDDMPNIAKKLSGGEKRRIDLARMLLRKRLFYVFDEPTTGLDPKTAEELETKIFHLYDGFLLITHRFNQDLFSQSDNIIVVKNGSISAEGQLTDERIQSALSSLKLV